MKNSTSETASESEAIRSDIEQTRESMDRTLDKIGERMKPQHLLDEALDYFRSHAGEGEEWKHRAENALHSAGEAAGRAASGMANMVKKHPVPAFLIGAGITWAIVEAKRSRSGNGHHENYGREEDYSSGFQGEFSEETGSESMGAKASQKFEEAKESLKEKGQQLKEKGHELKEKTQQWRNRMAEEARRVGKQASGFVAQKAKRGYEVGRERFVRASDEHPLSMGMGFLAAGVLVGLALPHTRREDSMCGEVADEAKEMAKSKARDLMESGKKVVSAATSAATNAAKETAKQEGLCSSSSSQENQSSGNLSPQSQPPTSAH